MAQFTFQKCCCRGRVISAFGTGRGPKQTWVPPLAVWSWANCLTFLGFRFVFFLLFLSSFIFRLELTFNVVSCSFQESGRPWWLDVSVIYDAVSFVLFPLPGEVVARFAWKRGCEAEHTARGAGLLRHLSSAPPGGRGKVGVEGFFLGRLLARLTGEELSKKLRGKKKNLLIF